MKNRLKHNIKVIIIYSIIIFVLLLPFNLGLSSITLSILIGFLFNILNDILTQLRMLNGEKFPTLEDEE